MPRKLLRDGLIVDDDWTHLSEAVCAAAESAGSGCGIILTFDQWLADKAAWLAGDRRLGVILSPADKVDRLAPDLSRMSLVGADFPGPSEGRGYTQGRLLRERYGWTGELRATGYVRRDQLFFLARCGFNSFELADEEFEHAGGALCTFSAEYQPANDAGLSIKLQHR